MRYLRAALCGAFCGIAVQERPRSVIATVLLVLTFHASDVVRDRATS